LAPTMRVLCHSAEIFLESKTDPAVVSAGSYNPGHRLQHRVDSAMIRRPAGQVRVKSVAHHGHSVRFALQYRKFSHHGLRFRKLILAAIRHEHASRTNGTVKHLYQA